MWNAASTLTLRRTLFLVVSVIALSSAVPAAASGAPIRTSTHGTQSPKGSPQSPKGSPDTQAPSAPGNLSLAAAGATSLGLSWSAASDNVGVSGYDVFLNGSKVGSTSAAGYSFGGLVCGTGYTLAVDAYDAAGNRSAMASVVASTSPCADTVAPTSPGPLLETGADAGSISLSWPPSLDNVGVAGYGVYVNGSRVASTSLTSYTVTGLGCGSSYTLAVDAYDAAGNRSVAAAVVATTTACVSSRSSVAAAADTYASQVNPDTVHGAYSYLRVLGSSGSTRNGYLRFDVAGLSGAVSQATLKLFPTSSSSAGVDVHAEPDTSWQESGLTWNNAPGFASAVSASSGPLSANSPVAVDVTSLVQGNGSVSFVLTSSDASGVYLASRESANPPLLEVTTSGGADTQAPSAPANLSLGAAGSSSLTLAWGAASDNVGVVGYDLYLNGSKVATTSATGYSFGGLACGTGYTLAVDAYDAAGNRSAKTSLATATAACLGAATGTTPGTGFMAFGGTLSKYADLSKAAYVIFGSDFSVAQPLPGKTLTYTDGTTINTSWSGGVSYADANANGWLLKDAAGNYVHPYRDSSRYLGDVGDAGYRQRFISNMQALLAAHPGIDGIEIDNVLPDVAYFSTCSCWPAKYPSATAWQDALVGFVQTVGKALRANGSYVMINATGYINRSDYDSGLFDQNWWARLAQSGGVNGIFYENFMQDPNNLPRLMDDSAPGSYMHSWAGWQKLISVAQTNGVDFFGITAGPSPLLDPAGAQHLMRYGRGSFLLDWNGGGGMFGYAVTPAYTSGIDAWDPAWTSDIGTPTGAKYQVGTNVWRRDYTNGSVIVNPTLNPVTTTIAGTSRTIPATDALILHN